MSESVRSASRVLLGEVVEVGFLSRTRHNRCVKSRVEEISAAVQLIGDGEVVVTSTEGIKMAFKPNYKFERRKREEAKAAKRAERVQAKAEAAEKRKTENPEERVPSRSDQ